MLWRLPSRSSEKTWSRMSNCTRRAIGQQQAAAEAEVHGLAALFVELGAADAGDQVDRGGLGALGGREDFAGQQVVAGRELVVAERLLAVGEDATGQHLAECLVADLALPQRALDEPVFGDVVAQARADHRRGAEVLGRIGPGEQADGEVLRRELGQLTSRRSTSGTTTWLLSGRAVCCAMAPPLPSSAGASRQAREILFMLSARLEYGGG